MMIRFQTEEVRKPDIQTALVKEWLVQVAALHNREVGNLTYMFCSDERILEVNRQFLGHDYYTDIITFDYSTPSRVSGDLYISLDTVLSNSEKYHVPFLRELNRVIVHGLLHLCGINDKGRGERAVMEAHENRALELLDSLTIRK